MAPVLDATSANSILWKPEPNSRGSFSIISSCVLTLVLCVWTSVHPNAGEGWKARIKRLLFALFAPEAIVYFAWLQRRSAVSLDLKAKLYFLGEQRYSESEPDGPFLSWRKILVCGRFWICQRLGRKVVQTRMPQKNCPTRQITFWTPVHSFFAVMGGFVFDTTGGEPFLPGSKVRTTLTPEGVAFLMRHSPELIPHLTKEQILDKSKADGLSKTLVCLQAGWFCLQCIARVAQRLPISLLELTTVAHALCMLVAYFLWWNKPLNVREPVIISVGDDMACRELLAYMCMSSTYIQESPDGVGWFRTHEFGSIFIVHDTDPDWDDLRLSVNPHVRRGFPVCLQAGMELGHTGFSVFPFSNRLRVLGSSNWLQRQIARVFCPTQLKYAPAMLWLDERDVRRWMLASSALDHYALDKPSQWYSLNYVMEFPLDDIAALAMISSENTAHEPKVALRFAMISALYGGLHLLAWNHNFPSDAEVILWRWCTICVTIFGIIYSFAGCLENWCNWCNDLPHSQSIESTQSKTQSKRQGWWFQVRHSLRCRKWSPDSMMLIVLLPFYAAAVLLLFVLCVLDIFHLPPESFKVISWSTFVPHLS